MADDVLETLQSMANGSPVTAGAIAMRLGIQQSQAKRVLTCMMPAGYVEPRGDGWVVLAKEPVKV